jgi:hypothetical protein
MYGCGIPIRAPKRAPRPFAASGAVPFLDLLAEHGAPHGLSERAASPPPLPTLEAEAVA